MSSWFVTILQKIEGVENSILTSNKVNSDKLDQILTLEKQNAEGIKTIIGYLTPPLPVGFKVTIMRN
jgi:hypothetical protein